MTEHKQLQSYRCHWLTGLFLSLISCIHFPHMACCSFPDTRYSSGVATLCILTLFSWVLIGFHAATGLWPGASWQGFIDEQQMLWPKTPAVLLEQGGNLISPRTSFCFWIHPRAQRDASLLLFMQIKRSEVSFSVSLSARTPFFFLLLPPRQPAVYFQSLLRCLQTSSRGASESCSPVTLALQIYYDAAASSQQDRRLFRGVFREIHLFAWHPECFCQCWKIYSATRASGV